MTNINDLHNDCVMFEDGTSDRSFHELLIGDEDSRLKACEAVKKHLEDYFSKGVTIGIPEGENLVEKPVETFRVDIIDIKEPDWSEKFVEMCRETETDRIRYVNFKIVEYENGLSAHTLRDYMQAIAYAREDRIVVVPIFHNIHYAKKNPGNFATEWTDFIWASKGEASAVLSIDRSPYDKNNNGGVQRETSYYKRHYVNPDFF